MEAMEAGCTVITWQSAPMSRVNITPIQQRMMEDAEVWPKDGHGREYCQVYYGAHLGIPTWTNKQIKEMFID